MCMHYCSQTGMEARGRGATSSLPLTVLITSKASGLHITYYIHENDNEQTSF